ncbi:pisatin demethylase [Tricladium varicosporioides]|nr:pisatin demethylase [Hymenoscyphus varicosporioides]
MTAISSLFDLLYAARYHILLLVGGWISWQQWTSYQRLTHFKGPTLAAFSSLWMASAVGSKKMYLKLYDISLRYGELTRAAPNILLTGDPDLIQRMNAARSPYTKSNWYAGQRAEADRHNLFSTKDEEEHTRRRAQMAVGYSGKEIDGLEGLINNHVLALVNLIRRKYITTGSDLRPFDLALRASFFTMDVITDISFGQTWGCLDTDSDVADWFKTQETVMPAAIQISTIPWLAKLLRIPFVGKMVMPSDKDEKGAGKLLGIAKSIVEKRFATKGHEDWRDMMGSFIRRGVTKEEAVTEAGLQIVAGADTTATTIRATALYVITNPSVYRKLQSEIDSFHPQNTIISDKEATSLLYLIATIKEGLRMWPPTTGLLSKVVPPAGDTFKGCFIPGGTEIGISFWALERNKEIFGEDAGLFRPERWLEANENRLENMERTLGLVFGSGKYSCLGKNIAWMELGKVIFNLFKNFEFTLIDPSHPWNSRNVGLWLQKEMFVKVTDRVHTT